MLAEELKLTAKPLEEKMLRNRHGCHFVTWDSEIL
jgi:hypothetical protein